MQLILLRGYPGAGKTTLGRRLEQDGYGVLVDTNYMLSCISHLVGDAYSSDMEIYDQMVQLEQMIISKLLRAGKDVIVARGFSGEAAVNDYTELADEAGAETFVIRLDAPQTTLEKRITAPDREQNYGFFRTVEQLRQWTSDHTVDPVEDELVVDTTRPIDDCVKDVVEYILREKP